MRYVREKLTLRMFKRLLTPHSPSVAIVLWALQSRNKPTALPPKTDASSRLTCRISALGSGLLDSELSHRASTSSSPSRKSKLLPSSPEPDWDIRRKPLPISKDETLNSPEKVAAKMDRVQPPESEATLKPPEDYSTRNTSLVITQQVHPPPLPAKEPARWTREWEDLEQDMGLVKSPAPSQLSNLNSPRDVMPEKPVTKDVLTMQIPDSQPRRPPRPTMPPGAQRNWTPRGCLQARGTRMRPDPGGYSTDGKGMSGGGSWDGRFPPIRPRAVANLRGPRPMTQQHYEMPGYWPGGYSRLDMTSPDRLHRLDSSG